VFILVDLSFSGTSPHVPLTLGGIVDLAASIRGSELDYKIEVLRHLEDVLRAGERKMLCSKQVIVSALLAGVAAAQDGETDSLHTLSEHPVLMLVSDQG
jgi:hypothetical protein